MTLVASTGTKKGTSETQEGTDGEKEVVRVKLKRMYGARYEGLHAIDLLGFSSSKEAVSDLLISFTSQAITISVSP